ncbi:MAG: hypothetical protein JO023_24180 [Chloroflexi bacterium]|nr:hypothetical protein [Chloroflexota bacterium]
MRRAPGAPLFALALVLALVVTFALRNTHGFAIRTEDGGYEGDIESYIDWTRLVTLGGIQAAYSGTFPETYAVYPPVTLSGFWLVGNVYRWRVDPTFERGPAQGSLWLYRALKALALAWQLLTAGAIVLLVRRLANARLAWLAGAFYLVNPAILFDTAHWAQPDGAHSLFSVLAVGWLSLGAPLFAWAALALAALAKPQAWAILPLLIIATWRLGGPGSVVRGVLVAAVTSLLVVLPFVLTGHLAELLSLPNTIATVLPLATADAHNLWWLVLAGRGLDPLATPESAPVIGSLSYRTLATLLVLVQLAFVTWLYWSRRVGLAEAAALGALGWFVTTTQAHENHLIMALPLLSLAWPTRRSLLVPYAVLSLTVFANMALQDPLTIETLGRDLQDPLLVDLRLLNAAINVLTLVVWSVWAALRPRPLSRAPSAGSADPAVEPARADQPAAGRAVTASGAAPARSR